MTRPPGPPRVFSRAQRLAIDLEGRDLLVAAGAGTGKTAVLVERVLRKLREGVELDSLLVVTFTEKAAAEMKERIHRALSQDPRLRRQLPFLPRAAISTIHAFCARLLREHFLLAGVDAGFRVLDENGAREAMEDALRRTFHDWYIRGGDEGRVFQELVELAGFGETGEELREIVRRLYSFARSTPEPAAYLATLGQRCDPRAVEEAPWSEDWIRALSREWLHGVALYAEVVRVAEESGADVTKLGVLLQALQSFNPRTVRDETSRTAFLRSLRDQGLLEPDDGVVDVNWPRAPKGANGIPGWESLHKYAKQVLEGRMLNWLSATNETLLAEEAHQNRSLSVLVSLVAGVEAVYSRYKDRNGFLDYSDLEVRTAQLLREHGDSLGLQDRYAEVLVDEYQDVNPLQESILLAVSRPGRRFRVGDVKQSIYRFRLADPRIFSQHVASGEALSTGNQAEETPSAGSAGGRAEALAARDQVEEPGGDPQLALELGSPSPASSSIAERPGSVASSPRDVAHPGVIYLNDNHRSRPEILHFVNRVFAKVFDEGTIGSRYEEQALVPMRESARAPHPIEFYWIDLREARGKAGSEPGSGEVEVDLRELQPRVVARRLRNLATDPVLRDENGECDWSRVVILLRARTAAERYRDALAREGIPCILGEGGSLLEETAARDLVNLLRVIDNPRDDIAVAAVLRSPLFAFADSDLLRIRLAHPAARTYLDAAIGAALLGASGPAPAWVDAFVPPDADPARGSWTGEPRASAEEIVPPPLRHRLAAAFSRIAVWRARAERAELGRLLVDLLEETHFHALTKGDPQQDACLEKLVALARACDAERGPSLRGFLARLDALEAAGGIDSVPAQTAARSVRVLTIHRAKGLEFPVVVLPELGWRFYGKDRLASRIRIGPEYVGLRRFDPEQHLRVDSIARAILEQVQEQERREEEARVLYVACTRARERLLLVGAGSRKLGEAETEIARRVRGERAFEYLRWIENALPWEESRPVDSDCLGESSVERRQNRPEADTSDGLESILFPALSLIVTKVAKRWVANLAAGAARGLSTVREDQLPAAARGPGLDAELWGRIARVPPRPPLSLVPALRGKYWVTELGRVDDASWFRELRENATTIGVPGDVAPTRAAAGASIGGAGEVPPNAAANDETPAEIGVRYHMVLSRLDLSSVALVDPAAESMAALSVSVDRMLAVTTREPWWGGAEREPRLDAGLIRFLGSPLGQRMARAARRGGVEREVSFSLRWPVSDLLQRRPDLVSFETLDPRWDRAAWEAALEEAWVLIQGRIDCVFEDPDGERRWVVVDWKTDRVGETQALRHASRYQMQMQIYAEAVRRLWGAPVEAHLAYLWPGTSVEVR